MARVQQVKRFAVLPNEFTVEGGELTATLKLRRRVIHARYADTVSLLFAPAESVSRLQMSPRRASVGGAHNPSRLGREISRGSGTGMRRRHRQ